MLHRNGPAPPRRSPRPAPSSVERSASQFSAASARPCTVAGWQAPSLPAFRRKRRARRGARWGGALAVAERLPEQVGAALLGPAREAFTHGMQLNAAICAVI